MRPLVDVVEEEYITADSKLTKDRSVVIVTTASLPWMTGTAVNPALRAAYMVGTGYEDVTLLLPWLEDDADQKTLFNGRVFANKSDQESFVRDWISKNAPDADASSLKLGWYPSRYATGLGSILNLDDITSHIPSDKNDIVILEEPEHLNWYRNGPRWTSRFRHVCGIAHTNYEAYAIADNFDKDGAPEEYFNVKAERSVLRRPIRVATAPTRLASTRRGRGWSLFDFRGHESVRAGSSQRRSLEPTATWWSSCRGPCDRYPILASRTCMG